MEFDRPKDQKSMLGAAKSAHGPTQTHQLAGPSHAPAQLELNGGAVSASLLAGVGNRQLSRILARNNTRARRMGTATGTAPLAVPAPKDLPPPAPPKDLPPPPPAARSGLSQQQLVTQGLMTTDWEGLSEKEKALMVASVASEGGRGPSGTGQMGLIPLSQAASRFGAKPLRKANPEIKQKFAGEQMTGPYLAIGNLLWFVDNADWVVQLARVFQSSRFVPGEEEFNSLNALIGVAGPTGEPVSHELINRISNVEDFENYWDPSSFAQLLSDRLDIATIRQFKSADEALAYFSAEKPSTRGRSVAHGEYGYTVRRLMWNGLKY